jgi:hypothetical protein
LFGSGKIFEQKVLNNFENKILLQGADIQNMYMPGFKIVPVDNSGQMIVLNSKIDKEKYEQCNAYSKIKTDKKNTTIDFIVKLFERNYND